MFKEPHTVVLLRGLNRNDALSVVDFGGRDEDDEEITVPGLGMV